MDCKFCHAKNVDDAVYCKSCGKRIDGKRTCPRCKRFVVDDATYCNYCGTRLDGKTVNETGEIVVKPRSDKWKNILSCIETAFALFGVVVSLIFVCLIGFGANVNNMSTSDLPVDVNLNGINIYHYFGKNFEEIQKALDQQVGNIFEFDSYEFISPSMYIPAILCTIIAAATIIAVVTFSILAIIKLIRKLIGKETKHAEGFAFAAFLSYALGSALLHVFNNISVSVNDSISSGMMDTQASARVLMTYSPATIAGLTLGAIAMFVCLGCRVACLGEEFRDVPTMVNVILGGGSLVYIMLVASFASNAPYAITGAESGAKLSLAMPINTWLTMWAQRLGVVSNSWDGEFFMLTITMILQLALVAVAMTSILLQVNALLNHKKNTALGINIALMAVAIVNTAFTIVTQTKLAEMLGGNDDVKLTFVPCIIALVFAFLALATSIARVVIKSVTAKRKAAATTAQPAAEEAPPEQAPAAE